LSRTDEHLHGGAVERAASASDSIHGDGEPVFREPWEAQTFALAVALQERGVFTWREWASTLAEEIGRAQAAGDPDTGETHYRHWLAALERLVSWSGLASPEALEQCRDAWGHAAARTPHGEPIELAPRDYPTDNAERST
jgi:nitrile hydratase accessory protein